MAAHKRPASLRSRCTRSGSSVAMIPVYQFIHEATEVRLHPNVNCESKGSRQFSPNTSFIPLGWHSHNCNLINTIHISLSLHIQWNLEHGHVNFHSILPHLCGSQKSFCILVSQHHHFIVSTGSILLPLPTVLTDYSFCNLQNISTNTQTTHHETNITVNLTL
jgi:hypothetical protein